MSQLKRCARKISKSLDAEEKAENARLWKYDRLRPVEQSLSEAGKNFMSSCLLHGEGSIPNSRRLLRWRVGHYGLGLPRTRMSSLRAVSVESLIAYLQDWAPSDTRHFLAEPGGTRSGTYKRSS